MHWLHRRHSRTRNAGQVGTGRGPAWLLALLAIGCGDDLPATPEGSTGTTAAPTTDTSADSTGGSDSTGEPDDGAWQERATQFRFDPSRAEFWGLPWPSDLRLDPDGTFDTENWPGDHSDTLQMWLDTADERMRGGWGTGGGIVTTFTGRIDPATLPGEGAPSLAADSSVYLLDIDASSPTYGERLPIRMRWLPDAMKLTEARTLTVLPVFGFVRRSATTYALVVTDRVLDTAGDPIGRSEAFHLAFEDQPMADPTAVEHLAPLHAAMVDLGLDPDEVMGAAVFTTASPEDDLLALAQWAETQPTPAQAEPWTVAQEYESYQVLTARFTVPVIQNGERPYSEIGEGRIVWDDAGMPEIQSTQDVRLALTIPKQPMPAGGFPLTMYLHGSGGEYYEAIDRGPRLEIEDAPPSIPGEGPAEWLARRGVATVAHDFPLHGDRNSPPDMSGLLLYNIFGNSSATIDNFNVSAMELVLLSRFMLETTVDETLAPTLDAGGAADGMIRFDPTRLTAMGQSMGTTLGVRWASVDPRLQGAVWSGAGGTLIEIAVHAIEPLELAPIAAGAIEIPLPDLTDGHPVLSALQHAWDFADPTTFAPHVVHEPFPGLTPKHTMMSAGFLDGYFTPISQAAIGTGLGVSIVGDSVEPVLPTTLELSGHPAQPPPMGPGEHGVVAGVIHVAAPFNLGHYVVFNQDAPRYQYTCFLASVGTPGGALIPAPGGLNDPCP